MKKKEVVFVVLLAGGMLGTGIMVGIMTGWWFLFGVFVIFFLCFGLMEWWATIKTDMSISQQYWKFKEEHPVAGWTGIAALTVAWLALMYHFGFHKEKED